MQLTAPANNLGFKVNKANAALRSLFNRYLREAGGVLTPEQWGIIQFLIAHPGVKQNEIVKEIRCDQTTLTRMLDAMQKKKLIRRDSDQSDRRAFRIFATDEAVQAHREALPFVKKYNEAVMKIISDNECSVVIKTLDKIISGLK